MGEHEDIILAYHFFFQVYSHHNHIYRIVTCLDASSTKNKSSENDSEHVERETERERMTGGLVC